MAIILVTGAAGFIGSHTCDLLLDQGHRVVGLDNFRSGRRENLTAALARPGFEFHGVDVSAGRELEAIASASRPQAIIHLAGLVSVQESLADPALNQRLNFTATQRVFHAARVAGAERIVFASSAAVYGDNPEIPLTENSFTAPISPYGAAKLASEGFLLTQAPPAGISARCLRYFNVYGPRQDPHSPYSGVISKFVDRLHQGASPTVFGDGEQTRDFVFVGDVARANALSATTPHLPSGVTNVCSGRPASLNQLVEILRSLLPGGPPPIKAAAREGDIRHSLGHPQAARAGLGFEAKISLQEGLAEILRTIEAE